MIDEKRGMDPFRGLPMESLIGGPLSAAIEAQAASARAQAELAAGKAAAAVEAAEEPPRQEPEI